MLIDQVARYLALNPSERQRVAALHDHMKITTEIFHRDVMPGHVTASGIVIRNDEILTVFHPFLKKWLQPGGHIEVGEAPIQAAEREILEESGLQVTVHPWHQYHQLPFDIDVHSIPANPSKLESAHLHYDFRYLFLPEYRQFSALNAAHLCSWKKVIEIDEPHLRALIRKLQHAGISNK